MINDNLTRTHGTPQAKGYSEAGASLIRRALKAFTPSSGAPIEDIDWNNRTLRQRGRILYMASPVATSAINTNRTKVIGTGLTLKSMINRDVLGLSPEAAKEWESKAEAEFNLWASAKQNCDAIGVNNFAGLQQLALKSWLTSGDVFALIKRYELFLAGAVANGRIKAPGFFTDPLISAARLGARAQCRKRRHSHPRHGCIRR